MQNQLWKQPPILNQLIVVCGVGLLMGITSLRILPYMLAVGIAGVIYVIVAWLRPEFAILSILVLTSTIIDMNALPSISIGVGHILISDILLFVLIGIIFLRSMVDTKSYFVHTPLDIALLAFYITAVLSTAIAIFNSSLTFNQSLGELRIVNYYLVFFLVTNLVRNDKQLHRLLSGIIFLAILVALAMIAQYALGAAVPILPGRVETLDTAGTTSYGVTRVLPPGQSLVMLGFVSLAVQMLFHKTSSRFIIYLVQLGIVGLAVLLTFNRSFWAAIALALFLVGLLVSIRDKIMYAQIAIFTVLVAALVLTPFRAVKGGLVEKLVNGITIRMSTLFNSHTLNEGSLQYRYIENAYAYPQIVSHPLFGFGLGANFRPPDRRLRATDYIHNGHLYIMLKTGLTGYLFFIWCLLLFVKRGFQNWKRISDPLLRGTVLSSTAVVVGILVATFVNPIFMQSYWTPIIGVMMGVTEVILRTNQNRYLDLHSSGWLS